MKEPIELTKRGTDEVIAYACGTCGTVVGTGRMHGAEARPMADRHCGPWLCRVCGCEHDWQHQTICRPCWNAEHAARQREREAKLRAKAAEVPAAEHEGWVSDGEEGFWPSVEEAVEHYEDEGYDVPAWLWACERMPLSMDADSIIEHALEEHYDGAADQISGKDIDRLQQALNEWCESVGIESWQTDYSRVVIL